ARAVALRGQTFPLPPREPVGAAVPKTAPTDVDPRGVEPGDRALVRGTRLPVYGAGDQPRADLRPVGLLRGHCRRARVPGRPGELRLPDGGVRRRDGREGTRTGQSLRVRRRGERLFAARAHPTARL